MFIQFYCFVSLGSAQSSLNNVERYDPRTNTWAPVAPMLKKRSLLNVAVLDGNNLFFHRGTLLCMLLKSGQIHHSSVQENMHWKDFRTTKCSTEALGKHILCMCTEEKF